MTIEQFLKEKIKDEEIDQLYVRDCNGNYITATGDTEYEYVDVTYYPHKKFVDIVFVVKGM